MLYNIIITILGLYAVLSPFFMLKFLKIGYKMGNSEEIGERRTVLKRKIPRKRKMTDKEREQIEDSLANIEAYNGTSLGQKEIK